MSMSSVKLPGGRAPSVMRLLNSIVEFCLVYGIDETSTRELDILEEGDIQMCVNSLLHRDIKLHFLQILAPGHVYPDRSSPHVPYGSCPSSPSHQEEGNLHSLHSKKFNVEDLGPTWETVETIPGFIFPEGPQLYSEDLEPSIIPMLLTNIDGARSYATGLRFSRPFFIQKPDKGRYYNLVPWKDSMQPPPNSRLIYLPTCCVLVSQHPYFKFMKEALSGFHRVLTNEDEQVDFWEAVQLYTERLFLIPSLPSGMLAMELQLPGFSSNLTVWPPRGENYLDIRLHYPFLCLSVDSVLEVISALLTEQRVIFISSYYPMLTYVIQCFLTFIAPFDWRHPCVPILPQQLLECLDAPGTILLGCHTSVTDTPEFKQVDDAVIIDLDNGVVTCRTHDPPTLPHLPTHALDTFKTRYTQLMKKNFSIEELLRLSHSSAEDLEQDRTEFEHCFDDWMAKMFLELMVNTYSSITTHLLHSRIKYEEALKEMPPEDQEFYKYATSTDMFSSFYQSRRQGTQRDDFTLLAERVKKQQRRTASEDDFFSSGGSLPRHLLRPSMSLGAPQVSLSTRNTVRSTVGSTSRSPRLSIRHSITMSASYRSLILGHSSLPTTPSIPEELSRISSIGPQLQGPVELVKMEFPNLQDKLIDRTAFIEEVIELLSELMENKAVQAQCVYLRGFYWICQKKFIRAFDDFYDTLQRLEIQLVPHTKVIQKIVSYLSPSELEELKSKDYHQYIVPRKKKAVAMATGIRRHQTVSYNVVNLDKKMPKRPLGLNEFLKIVRENAIATDAESASNLHRVLSQGRTTNIDPETFGTFYEAFKEVLQDNEAVDIPGVELEKADKSMDKMAERVLAVSSSSLRTNFHTHCTVILTTYRLLAVSSFKTYVMADLRKAIRFDKCDCQLSVLGVKSPGIRVEHLEKKPVKQEATTSTTSLFTRHRAARLQAEVFVAFLNSTDRDNWYHMIVEMKYGRKLSLARKDPSILETAECHVILQNAVNQSGLLDRYNHCQRIKVALKLLNFQSRDVSEVSKFTVEALQYRINPCLHETERQTVESLLHIPPFDPLDSGEQGKLWIGLGNGRLKVYDMEAKCFESDIKITETRHGVDKSVRLSCLLLVGQHVWVGSISRSIHILDAETVCHVSQLSYLEEVPRDLALSHTEPTLVWSLLVNGVLLAWDPETRTRVFKMQVPMSGDHSFTTCTCFSIWRDHIWVGTNRGAIVVMDSTDGRCVQEIFFPGGRRRQVEIKHLALSSEEEVWCSVYSIPRGEDTTFIAVFDPTTHEKKLQYNQLDNRVSIILPVNNTMWCGTKSGKIYIFNSRTYAEGKGMPKILSAHDDSIRTMTTTELNQVISGSGSNDGYAAVWKAITLP